MRLLALLGCALLCTGAGAFNILAIYTVATHSHFLWTNTLITELLARGHKVTELTFKQPEPHPNRTSFVLESGLLPQDLFMNFINSAERGEHFLKGILHLFQLNVEALKDHMTSKVYQDFQAHLLSTKPRIDLILFDNAHRDNLGVSRLVGYPPIVTMTAFNHPLALNIHTGSPQFPALIPHEASPYSCEMSFSERVVNFIGHSWFRLIEKYYFEREMDQHYREVLSPDFPSYSELELNVSVALVNTHPTTHCEQPSTASVVEVGFLHIKPPKPLPKDIKKFLDEADNGVIVVSFGSMVRPDLIPGLQDKFLAVFGKFKQRILWKTPNPPKNLPPHVLASEWLPQSDALAHPNVRMIISHGGTLSMQEAVYRGVPILVIPFYLDQEGNGNRMVSRGVGRILNFNRLTVETLSQEIKAILENATYKKNMQRLSAIAQDQPDSPLQRAVFWVEFVGRHKGAPFLNNDTRRFSWLQYYSIDVIAFLALLVILVVTISILCLRWFFRLLKCKRKIKVN